MEPNPVIIAATAKHTASLIFLHGLGDTGHGWASTIAAIRGPHVKVICPTASTMPVTLNAGFRMPSWFDLRSLDASSPEDEDGIVRATSLIHNLITDEIKAGIPSNRIILGGFSQGGALALHAGLTYIQPLAGIIALSCWLPRHAFFPDAVKAPLDIPSIENGNGNKHTLDTAYNGREMTFLKTIGANKITAKSHTFENQPICINLGDEGVRSQSKERQGVSIPYIFQAHGDCDPVVPFKWGQMTASFLKTFLKNIEFTTYQGLSHSSSDAELKDMRAFIEKCLPSTK